MTFIQKTFANMQATLVQLAGKIEEEEVVKIS
jgi:hypothetical protein